jgi:hypothetical protein
MPNHRVFFLKKCKLIVSWIRQAWSSMRKVNPRTDNLCTYYDKQALYKFAAMLNIDIKLHDNLIL